MENAGKKTPACRGFGFGHRAYRRIFGCHGGRGRTRAFRGSRAGSEGCRAFWEIRAGSEGCRAFRGSCAGSECRCAVVVGCRAGRSTRARRAFRGRRAGSEGCRAFRGRRAGSEGCRAFWEIRAGSECRRAFRGSCVGSEGCRAFRGSRVGSEGCRAFRGSRTRSTRCRAFRGSRAGSAGCRAGGLVDGVLEEVFAGGKRFANNRLRALAADFQHVAQVARARGFRADGGARRPRRVVGNVQRKRGDRRASDRSQQAAAVKADARPEGRGGGHGERDRQRGSRLARGQRDFGFRVVAAHQLAPV